MPPTPPNNLDDDPDSAGGSSEGEEPESPPEGDVLDVEPPEAVKRLKEVGDKVSAAMPDRFKKVRDALPQPSPSALEEFRRAHMEQREETLRKIPDLDLSDLQGQVPASDENLGRLIEILVQEAKKRDERDRAETRRRRWEIALLIGTLVVATVSAIGQFVG